MNSQAESQTRGVSAVTSLLRTFPWLPGCPDQPVRALWVRVFQDALATQLCFEVRGPDQRGVSLGRGCRHQQALGGSSLRRYLQSPKSPTEGESPPSWTQLQKSHSKNEEVPGRVQHGSSRARGQGWWPHGSSCKAASCSTAPGDCAVLACPSLSHPLGISPR